MSGLLGGLIQAQGVSSFGTNSNDDSRASYVPGNERQCIVWYGDRYSDILWPRSSLCGPGGQDGLGNGANGGMVDNFSSMWEYYEPPDGIERRFLITGVTRDKNGNPLGGCTVQLFNTATGLLVDTQVSDSAGNYSLGDPNGVACFVVSYLDGGTPVTGATLNTITGT